MTLYARFAAHIDSALDALEAEGKLAPGLDRSVWEEELRAILAEDGD